MCSSLFNVSVHHENSPSTNFTSAVAPSSPGVRQCGGSVRDSALRCAGLPSNIQLWDLLRRQLHKHRSPSTPHTSLTLNAPLIGMMTFFGSRVTLIGLIGMAAGDWIGMSRRQWLLQSGGQQQRCTGWTQMSAPSCPAPSTVHVKTLN